MSEGAMTFAYGIMVGALAMMVLFAIVAIRDLARQRRDARVAPLTAAERRDADRALARTIGELSTLRKRIEATESPRPGHQRVPEESRV